MALDIHNLPYESGFGVTTANTLLAQEAAPRGLLVLLPGRGYTTDHPLLHYLMNIGLARGWDVLLLRYGFQSAQSTFFPDQLPLLLRESEAVIRLAWARRAYPRLCLAGKSLGTILAAQLVGLLAVPQTTQILLTPVQNSAAAASVPTLAVIGIADALYPLTDTQPTPLVTWQVLPGLNHALEHPDDWRLSLAALPAMMNACDAFLAAHDAAP